MGCEKVFCKNNIKLKVLKLNKTKHVIIVYNKRNEHEIGIKWLENICNRGLKV